MTGTTNDYRDAWFVGFTNDVTVAVWLGYDNSDGKRRTLGGGATGGHVAVPIFESVIPAVWAHVAQKAALAPPSAEAKRQLACTSVNLDSAETQRNTGRAVTECFRLDRSGHVVDTQYQLVSREDAYTTVQRNAAKAWAGESFQHAIANDPAVKDRLSPDQVAHCFDIQYHLKNLQYTFEKLGI